MIFHTKQSHLSQNKICQLKINDISIEHVNNFTFLGVIIDSTLSWSELVKCISNEISRTSGLLSRLKHCLPTNILKLIYNSLISSYLSYATPVWGFNSCKRIITIQKRAILNIVSANYNSHTEPIKKNLKILQFQDLLSKYTLLTK